MRWRTLRVANVFLAMLIVFVSLLPLLIANEDQSLPTAQAPTTTTTTIYKDRPAPPPKPATTTTTTTSTTLAPPTTTTTFQESTYQAASYSGDVWDRLAQCESGGNWGHRGRFEGGLQFEPYTWDAYVAAGKPYAMVGYPDAAYNATREQQIQVAIRVRDGVKGSSHPYLNPQGWNAWPTCRYEAGV